MNEKLAVFLGYVILGTVFGLLLFFAVSQVYSYFKYKNVEVTNYELLLKKAIYGKITNDELKIGIIDSIESQLCENETKQSREKCLESFGDLELKCTIKHLNQYDVSSASEASIRELNRRINFCL